MFSLSVPFCVPWLRVWGNIGSGARAWAQKELISPKSFVRGLPVHGRKTEGKPRIPGISGENHCKIMSFWDCPEPHKKKSWEEGDRELWGSEK